MYLMSSIYVCMLGCLLSVQRACMLADLHTGIDPAWWYYIVLLGFCNITLPFHDPCTRNYYL